MRRFSRLASFSTPSSCSRPINWIPSIIARSDPNGSRYGSSGSAFSPARSAAARRSASAARAAIISASRLATAYSSHRPCPPYTRRRQHQLPLSVGQGRERLSHPLQMRLVLFSRVARQHQAARQGSAGGAALEAQTIVRGIEAAQLGHGLFQGLVTGNQAALGGLVGFLQVLARGRPRLLAGGVFALRLGERHGVGGSGFGFGEEPGSGVSGSGLSFRRCSTFSPFFPHRQKCRRRAVRGSRRTQDCYFSFYSRAGKLKSTRTKGKRQRAKIVRLCRKLRHARSSIGTRLGTRHCYSCLSAAMGSTWVARRAGRYAASNAVPVSSKGNTARVTGSLGRTPYNRLEIN